MIVRFLFLLFNICILYSNSFDYYKLDVDYLNLSQKFLLGNQIFSSKNNINFDNEIFVKLQDKGEDDFLYKNIQENETLNVEKTIESNWGKRAFRFSAIGVGTFPIALLVSLFFFDLSYYFNNGMDSKYLPYPFSSGFKLSKDETFKKFMISASAGLAVSLMIALIDCLIY
ncbi:hypothetical protein DB313_00105 [Borrelia turcica IST7]|uniref:Uncharacterized protein n=1 Tax=Borrelia turcica IST7 TaxID=1104446 RepID=A0A386PJ69_9SPIR|nr:hypothetical protein [Borrelia turcica]AYE35921.1 hypothetical protein DB313_00105 [Borrelia turcica IST7]